MPAEWEPHAATWLAWPHNPPDWPGKLSPIYWVYAELVKKLVVSETVSLLVNDRRHEERARSMLARAGVDLARVEFVRVPTDRAWVRDSGPLFVVRDGERKELAVARFRFNGWARYDDWRRDNALPERLAARRGWRLFSHGPDRDMVLEGGSIDVNGRGSLLTTEECLLERHRQVRNPGMGREELERRLRDKLSVTNVLWLGRGIAGDDTHGHVDDICRFVSPDTVVLAREPRAEDANYEALAENRERLEGMRLEDGRAIKVVELPMPAPLFYRGRRLPASYVNFYVANEVVLVPTFNDVNDCIAMGVFSALFPGRTVMGIHAVDLVWGLGAIHCVTRDEPAV